MWAAGDSACRWAPTWDRFAPCGGDVLKSAVHPATRALETGRLLPDVRRWCRQNRVVLRRPGVGAEAAAELGALTGEGAPAAIPTGDDPVVQHPDVGQDRLGAAACGAFLGSRVFAAHDEAALQAQAAVLVVLMPVVI